jgi:hypothetical protein
MLRHLLLSLVTLALTVGVAGAQATMKTDVPAGKWTALRVRTVPQGAVLAVRVSLGGTIEVAVVRGPARPRSLNLATALFRARVERRLSFAVTAPAAGDYYVVLDNRRGGEAQAVQLAIQARKPSERRPGDPET